MAGSLGANSAHGDAQWVLNGPGLWSEPSNWSTGAVPSAENVFVNHVGGDAEAIIDFAAPSINEALIGQGGGPGVVRVQTGGSITTSHINLSYNTGGLDGTWIQEGGTLNASHLRLGRQDGGTGTFALSGGDVTSTGTYFAFQGTGTTTGVFDQSGGTHTTGDLYFGYQAEPTTTSTYNLSGGTLNSGHVRMLGSSSSDKGTATLNMSDGVLNSSGYLIVGRYNTGETASTATANFSGGTASFASPISVNSLSNLAATAAAEVNISGTANVSGQHLHIGSSASNATSDVTISGTSSVSVGEITVNRRATTGSATGGTGTASLTLSDNATLTSSSNLWVADAGADANVAITGGTLSTNHVRLGDYSAASTAHGSLDITGGTLNATTLYAGARDGGAGTGSITIGGDAAVNVASGFPTAILRAGAGNTLTVNGSDATINFVSSAETPVGLQLDGANEVNFNFDGSGISVVNLGASNLHLGADDLVLNVDASAVTTEGTYDLFSFGALTGYDGADSVFGTENLLFAEGYMGDVLYNPDSIQLTVSLIPEPTSLGLLGLGGLGLLRRRRA